jgi:predicted CXXCH cytochrome family protein
MFAKVILTRVCLGTVLILLTLVISCPAADNPFRLRNDATGKACLQCHVDAQDFKKQKHVHEPVKNGQCTSCHSPHASDHGALLNVEQEQLCLECHDDILPEKAVSKHSVISEQGCTGCHQPHASDYAALLPEPAKVICLDCHDEIQKLMTASNVHPPAKKDCMTCHEAHASLTASKLLTNQEPDLCLGCHNATSKNFKRQHMGYPVETARCSSCHNPHGSDGKGLFSAVSHSPVTKRMCTQCHAEPNSKEPFAVKARGYKLCQTCHNRSVNDTLNQSFAHWPVLGQDGCLSCHSPHASNHDGLLKDEPLKLCGSCHSATVEQIAKSTTRHAPITDGDCVACHSPHAADNPRLLKELNEPNLCGECHDWQAHASHPIGMDVQDPRNMNLYVQCSSCHGVHGTSTEDMLLAATVTDICVQCHTNYRR